MTQPPRDGNCDLSVQGANGPIQWHKTSRDMVRCRLVDVLFPPHPWTCWVLASARFAITECQFQCTLCDGKLSSVTASAANLAADIPLCSNLASTALRCSFETRERPLESVLTRTPRAAQDVRDVDSTEVVDCHSYQNYESYENLRQRCYT